MEPGGLKLDRSMLEESLDSVLAPDSLEVATEDVMPNSEDVVAMKFTRAMQELEMVLDLVVLPDSEMVAAEDMVPDSEIVLCVCCGTSHAADDSEGCFQACRRARWCGRCGLLHEDYDLAAKILHDLDHFDCEIYIPDLDKLVMHGDTIYPPKHVMKKLDAELKMKEEAKMKEDAKISKVHVSFIQSNMHA